MTTKPKSPAQSWTAQATAALSEAGYRSGAARNAIVATLGSQPCALSAPELERAVNRKAGNHVSRATVYRVLEQLDALKLVNRIEVGDGHTRFEPHERDGHHHHHMVCEGCGGLTPFEDPSLEHAIERLSNSSTFRVEAHDVVLHGICSDCDD